MEGSAFVSPGLQPIIWLRDPVIFIYRLSKFSSDLTSPSFTSVGARSHVFWSPISDLQWDRSSDSIWQAVRRWYKACFNPLNPALLSRNCLQRGPVHLNGLQVSGATLRWYSCWSHKASWPIQWRPFQMGRKGADPPPPVMHAPGP